jgi:hypothetical protein
MTIQVLLDIRGVTVSFDEEHWMSAVQQVTVILGEYLATLPSTSNEELIIQCLGGDKKTVSLTFPETYETVSFCQISKEFLTLLFRVIDRLIHPMRETEQTQFFKREAVCVVNVADSWHGKDGINGVFQIVITDYGTDSRCEIQAKMSQLCQDPMAVKGDKVVKLEFQHSAQWFSERLLKEQMIIKFKMAQESSLKVNLALRKATSEFERFQEYRHRYRHAKKAQRKCFYVLDFKFAIIKMICRGSYAAYRFSSVIMLSGDH